MGSGHAVPLTAQLAPPFAVPLPCAHCAEIASQLPLLHILPPKRLPKDGIAQSGRPTQAAATKACTRAPASHDGSGPHAAHAPADAPEIGVPKAAKGIAEMTSPGVSHRRRTASSIPRTAVSPQRSRRPRRPRRRR